MVWACSPMAWEQGQVGTRRTQQECLCVSWLPDRELWGLSGALWFCSLWESGSWEPLLREAPSSHTRCYGLNVCVPPPPADSYVEALSPHVMVLEMGPLGGN